MQCSSAQHLAYTNEDLCYCCDIQETQSSTSCRRRGAFLTSDSCVLIGSKAQLLASLLLQKVCCSLTGTATAASA